MSYICHIYACRFREIADFLKFSVFEKSLTFLLDFKVLRTYLQHIPAILKHFGILFERACLRIFWEFEFYDISIHY